MSRTIILGGGLAGMACAAALGSAGFDVELYEARSSLGGRAASFPLASPGEPPETIDSCQHILLRCCVNLLDFYQRLGVAELIKFHKTYYFHEPGGRMTPMSGSFLPAPLHLGWSFCRLPFLSGADKMAILRAMYGAWKDRKRRAELDEINMLEWLRHHGQTRGAIERFWSPVLISAVNEELERMSALPGVMVAWLGFLAGKRNYELGVPAAPLSELYEEERWKRLPTVSVRLRSPVSRLLFEEGRVRGVLVNGEAREADNYVCCLPWNRINSVAPELGLETQTWEHSPITGIHLWYEQPVTDLPHGVLLGRTLQWFFAKQDGRYLLAVVSASRSLMKLPREQIIAMAAAEMAEFLPEARPTRLRKAHVVREARATFSAAPGLETQRPGVRTRWNNLFLAGDWTRTGWPATMEGAVRSGYLAAEGAARSAGAPHRFLLPDRA